MLWLISRGENPLLEPLLVDGGAALAVFGHEQEAEMFLGLMGAREGWQAREVGAGKLASFLRGPYRPVVRRVALDPLPGNLLAGAAFGPLVCTDRGRFAEYIGTARPGASE